MPCPSDDSVEHVFSFVEAAVGTASVIVRRPEGGFGNPPGVLPADEADSRCPVRPDTHVDMLVTCLRRHAGPTHCRVVALNHSSVLVKELVAQA